MQGVEGHSPQVKRKLGLKTFSVLFKGSQLFLTLSNGSIRYSFENTAQSSAQSF